jgi:4-hydroxy-tetrahydrodipicolinate synthase
MPAMAKQPRSVQLWSAAPTPLTSRLEIDEDSVARMVNAGVADGLTGLFLAGTCGEGPWLPNSARARLVRTAATGSAGRLKIAVQVSDNSVPRILDNIDDVAAAGADLAILSHPAAMMNPTPERIATLFASASEQSPLPVGIYDLGGRRAFAIPADRLKSLYLHPKVRLVKDSSGAADRRELALAARSEKPSLVLLNGDEFRCVEYLIAGYDGCMFGGAVAIAGHLRRITELLADGRTDEAEAVEREMKAILYGIYGGEAIACWLTGLKYYLTRIGMFRTAASFLEYPLTDECRAFIENHAAAGQPANEKAAEPSAW